MEVSSWLQPYDDPNGDDDFLDDFEEQYNCDEVEEEAEQVQPTELTDPSKAETTKASPVLDKVNLETVVEEVPETESQEPQKRVTFQQDYHPPPTQQQPPLVDLNSRRLARHQSKPVSAMATGKFNQAQFDANDASIPSDLNPRPGKLTKPVILHGRLVERAQPDYTNIATGEYSYHRKNETTSYDEADTSNTCRETDPPIRDSMERRSVFYRLTSDTARLRSFVNALDDVIRQTREYQKTRRRSAKSCSVSSISPSSASFVSITVEDPQSPAPTETFRLTTVPRLLSAVPEGGDPCDCDGAALPETDANPETFQQLHHRDTQQVNIAAWRVTNLVTQAKALDASIWKTLYEYEQTLRGNTLQQRHQQSACLRLHKDYRRVNRALKLCLSRLSAHGSIDASDDLTMDDASIANSTAITSAPTRSSQNFFSPKISKNTAKPDHLLGPLEVPVSKVGWIGPKPPEAEEKAPSIAETPSQKPPTTLRPSRYREPIVVSPPAPRVIEARTYSRKHMEEDVSRKPLEKEEHKADDAPKDAPFYISFIPKDLDSMGISWVEDDTLTMFTLYEQQQKEWKKHIPYFLHCCGPSDISEHRDDFEEYRFDIDDDETGTDTDYEDEEARDPHRWNRRYYPRQRRKLALPKQPREAVF